MRSLPLIAGSPRHPQSVSYGGIRPGGDRRTTGGIVRIFVPPDVLEPREIVRKDVLADDRADIRKDVPTDIPKVMMILETAIASLTARAEHAERIADQECQRT